MSTTDPRFRAPWKVLGIYAGASWIVLQVVDLLAGNGILPTWAFQMALVILLVGLPLVAGTAWIQARGHAGAAERAPDGPGRSLLNWRTVAAVGVGALAVWGIAVTSWLFLAGAQATPVEVVAALAEIDSLVAEGEFSAAFEVAERMDRRVKDDSTRAELWSRSSLPVTLQTDPSGARVFRRDYGPADAAWQELGTTPLEVERFPLGRARLRFELAGHRTRELAGTPQQISRMETIHLDLDDALPPGMVRIEGDTARGDYGLFAPGLEQAPAVGTVAFLMAAHEVTNRQYKAFVDAGGYQSEDCWIHPFVDGGATIARSEAVGRFVDATGRPGPATWEAGSYRSGEADLPVGGVSWYEAAAYACYAGMDLPTVYHWYAAANPFGSPEVVPLSNFGDGPAAVGAYQGVSPEGVYDLAGNVREWTRNAHGEARFLLGGGWADLPYAFNDAGTAPAFDRSRLNGIRLVQYPDTTNLAAASAPLELAFRDYRAERPVSDEVFDVFRQMYAYERTPLNARVVARDSSELWIRERVEMDAGYGGERLTTFIFLPRARTGPLQTVVFFPGSNDIYARSYDDLDVSRVEFLIQSGRALVYPIYKGTFERGTGLHSDIQNESNAWRDHMIAWTKDLRRSIDYIETRDELDVDRLAYLGISWGGAVAPVMVALEPRIRTNVLIVGGLLMQNAQPVADPFHFLPRVHQPTLMINARWDSFYPLENSARPIFDNLGTPADRKRLVVLDANHGVFSYDRNTVIQETLDWLDRYLGEP